MLFIYKMWKVVLYLAMGIHIIYSQKTKIFHNIDLWIEECILHLNYSVTGYNSDCVPTNYTVIIFEGTHLTVNTEINSPTYSYGGIRSDLRYLVQVTPTFHCSNSSRFLGQTSENTISGIPEMEEKNIKANESENLRLVCPVHGAFQTVAVKWQHKAGVHDTSIRVFSTKILYLMNITYQDWGKYICTVKFKECGKSSVKEWTTHISLLVYGPPYFTESVKSFQTDDEHEMIKINLSLISFPRPSTLVELKNKFGITLSKTQVVFKTELVTFHVYGVKIEAPGYSTVVKFSTAVNERMTTMNLSLLASNDVGTRSHILFIDRNDILDLESENMSVWIKDCSLHVQWLRYNGGNDCELSQYRVQLYENNHEVTTADITGLKYSYDGIDSKSRYRVEVTPTLLCTNKSIVTGRTAMRTLSAIPANHINHISRRQSENLTMSCPLSGAFSHTDVEWHHTVGKAIVRRFTSLHVILLHVSYKDSGKYVCFVNYTSCKTNSETSKQISGTIYLSINGPPKIINMKNQEALFGQIDFALHVVSFPKPDSLVQIRGEDSSTLFQRSMNFESITLNLTVNGNNVYIMGYGLNFTAGNITDGWFGRNMIVISNMFGSHTYIFTVETTKRQVNRKTTDLFSLKNVGMISSVGTTLLLMVCIITAFGGAKIRKKMKRNVSLNRHKMHMEENRDPQRRYDSYEEPINPTGSSARHDDYSIPETYMEIETISGVERT